MKVIRNTIVLKITRFKSLRKLHSCLNHHNSKFLVFSMNKQIVTPPPP